MGKGKNGCSNPISSALDPELSQLKQWVEAGERGLALGVLMRSTTPVQIWRDWVNQLIFNEQEPDLRSAYRHLLSALYFERGSEQGSQDMLFEARSLIFRDTLDADTTPRYLRFDRLKLKALRSETGYFVRYHPQEDYATDTSRLQGAREMQRPVLLATHDEEQEIKALSHAFGDDLVIFPAEPAGQPSPVSKEALEAEIAGASRAGKLFAIRSSCELTPEAVDALVGVLALRDRLPGSFGFVWMLPPGSPHFTGPVARGAQQLDFTRWPERMRAGKQI